MNIIRVEDSASPFGNVIAAGIDPSRRMVLAQPAPGETLPSLLREQSLYLAPLRQGRGKSARLTERDRQILRTVGLARAIRLDDLAPCVTRRDGEARPLGERSLRDLIHRWELMGAATLVRNPWGGHGLVVAQPGIRAIPGLPEGLSFGLPSIGTLLHTLECARIACQAVQSGSSWVWEAELRPDLVGHRPDGLLVSPGGGDPVPVEVELTIKDRGRWVRIVRELVGTWGRCVYYAETSIAGRLVAWRDRDLNDVANLVSIKPIEVR